MTIKAAAKKAVHFVSPSGYKERRKKYIASEKKKLAGKREELSVIRARKRAAKLRGGAFNFPKKRKQSRTISRKSRIRLI